MSGRVCPCAFHKDRRGWGGTGAAVAFKRAGSARRHFGGQVAMADGTGAIGGPALLHPSARTSSRAKPQVRSPAASKAAFVPTVGKASARRARATPWQRLKRFLARET